VPQLHVRNFDFQRIGDNKSCKRDPYAFRCKSRAVDRVIIYKFPDTDILLSLSLKLLHFDLHRDSIARLVIARKLSAPELRMHFCLLPELLAIRLSGNVSVYSISRRKRNGTLDPLASRMETRGWIASHTHTHIYMYIAMVESCVYVYPCNVK